MRASVTLPTELSYARDEIARYKSVSLAPLAHDVAEPHVTVEQKQEVRS